MGEETDCYTRTALFVQICLSDYLGKVLKLLIVRITGYPNTCNIFHISLQKHMLWVLIRNALLMPF